MCPRTGALSIAPIAVVAHTAGLSMSTCTGSKSHGWAHRTGAAHWCCTEMPTGGGV